ncbi:hypothetical protein GQ457_03G019110 [Hibiscus cannabinus]
MTAELGENREIPTPMLTNGGEGGKMVAGFGSHEDGEAFGGVVALTDDGKEVVGGRRRWKDKVRTVKSRSGFVKLAESWSGAASHLFCFLLRDLSHMIAQFDEEDKNNEEPQNLQGETVTRRLLFSGSKITSLRDEINNRSILHHRPSRFEALAALIWTNPPLPQQCIGNVYRVKEVEPLMEKTTNLSILAEKLGEAVRKVDDEYVRKLGEGDIDYIKFLRNKAASDTFIFASWCRFPINRTVVLMDARDGEGIEAWITLGKEEMAKFLQDAGIMAYCSSSAYEAVLFVPTHGIIFRKSSEVIQINYKGREEENKREEKVVEKKEVEKKKLGIALKPSLEESDSSRENDEEMTMLAKRFTRFMNLQRGKRFQSKRDFKKSFGKKKTLKDQIATWSDEESSVSLMQGEFEMGMMGELSFFLGLQIRKREDIIFINQAMYIKDMLKKFGLENMKPQATPTSSSSKLDKDEGAINTTLDHKTLATQPYSLPRDWRRFPLYQGKGFCDFCFIREGVSEFFALLFILVNYVEVETIFSWKLKIQPKVFISKLDNLIEELCNSTCS